MGARAIIFWVYIIENLRGDFYIGHTDNLERRAFVPHSAGRMRQGISIGTLRW